MRVLQVGKYYHPYRGGMETHLRVLCEELRGRVDLSVVVANDRRREETSVVSGVEVHRCMPLATVASVALCPTMPWHMTRTDYDVVHIHLPHPVAAASYFASVRPLRHALVVTYHADVVRQRRLMHLYGPVLARLLARADRIVCASPHLTASPTLRPFGAKCEVIPFGIDLRPLEPTSAVLEAARRVRARLGEGPLLLGNGRLIYYKGFDVAIDALTRTKVRARLAVVGSGPLEGALMTRARERGVGDRVHLLGNVSDAELAALYHACDVFVLPSTAKSEAFALVQLEAMACRKPVINTQLAESGVPFVSRHGESGLTVKPGDADELARAIDQLLGDDGRRRELGEAGRSRVEREFSKEAMADRTMKVYERVLG